MSRTSRSSARPGVATLLGLALIACATTVDRSRLLGETLDAHASVVRWGDPVAGLDFVDPALRPGFEPTGLERERWRQFQVAAYRAPPPAMPTPDRAMRTVELELVNRNTQVARTLTWRQEWRYDAEARRWWLTSGLPSLEAGTR